MKYGIKKIQDSGCKIQDDVTSFSVSYILQRKKILRFAQNDILCHPERSEGSSYAITEKLVMMF